MNKKTLAVSGAIAMFLIALGITLYPPISTWYNQKHQSEIHTQYMEIVEQTDDFALQEARQQAEEYNAAIVPGAQLTESFSQDAILLAAEDYDSQLNLAGDSIMGYVEIPIIDVNLPIYHGTDAETLDAGIGHLLGTSLPVGGESTHTVLTAHSGMANQKLFSDLDKLGYGNIFYLQVLGETLAYQVEEINTVEPHDTSFLGISPGEDYCTLVTCTPFGVNTHRLLVRGTRVPYEEAVAVAELEATSEYKPASTWEQQYLKGIYAGVTIVAIACTVYLVFRLRKRGKYEAE